MGRMIDADNITYESIDSSDTVREEIKSGCGILAVRKEDIDAMPTIEPQRWIPVTERLPEETATYICTCFDGIANRVTFINFQKRYASWNLTGQRAYWKVIAWQPLPEPWKGES